MSWIQSKRGGEVIEWMYKHRNGVRFRKVARHDLVALLELKNESWMSRHRIVFLNMDDQEKWFESLQTHCSAYTPTDLVLVGITEDERGQDASFGIFKLINIDWQSRRAEAGWDVFPSYRKKGLGKKLVIAGTDFAKEVMGLHRLRAEILVTNHASRKCAEESGFRKEGVERSAIYRLGKYIDSELWGVVFE
jgi:ribosomal-protein-alanine N-acetyltransferase